MRSISTLVAAIGVLASTASALDSITIDEQDFIDPASGDRFMIIGVDYQPGGQSAAGTGAGDPLSNADDCLRDAALMQNLGVNTIRSYNVDPKLNHDECVSIFNEVGIYLLIDVNTPNPGQYIDRSAPTASYTAGYLEHVFTVIEAFKNYPNVLGFFAGNEIINTVGNAETCPPVIRAVQRDMKNYIANNSDRKIPVGYSAADVESLLADTWAYLQCEIDGQDDPSRSDFFGLNDYSWCGATSSYTISGYNILEQMFSKSTIPVFFSEYGCNDPQPRHFDEVPTLYSDKMAALSGGLVYEWSQEASNFGLVKLSGTGATILPDYNTLIQKFDGLDTDFLTKQKSTASALKPPTCGANILTNGGFSTSFILPKTPAGALDFITNGIPNPPAGKIVAVTKTAVSGKVLQTNGGTVEGLHIKVGATAANYPGLVKATTGVSPGTKSGGGGGGGSGGGSGSGATDLSSGSSGSSSSTSAKNAASAGSMISMVAVMALGVVVFAL